jgi:methionine sulfoxide reductase heme-binding subunit
MTDIPWTWFVMRASGLVAIALLTLAVVLGIIGPRLAPTARLTSITVHRAASVAGAALIVGHVLLAIIDQWITLDWPAVLLPGVAGWERWGVGLGALAVDLMIALLLTTATRLRWPRLWRRMHLVAYPVWAMAVGHGLLVGTDGTAMQVLALASAGLVLLSVAARLVTRPRSASRPALGAPAEPATVGGAR